MALSTVKKNIIANFLGKSWIGILNLVVTPIYVKLIGIESYGLLGVFASLLGLLALLDMGLSSMLSRELARLSSDRESAQEARDLVRTMEYVFWGIGIIAGLAVVALAPYLSRTWLTSESLPVATIEYAIMIMGVSIALQWSSGLYINGLIGMQQQVFMNWIRGIIAICQYAGALAVLVFLSRSIISFFIWQMIIGTVQTVLLAWSVWRSLPTAEKPASFQMMLIRKNWHFAAGMMGISVVVTLLTQLDKIILSRLLSLSLFGQYMLALNLANIVTSLVGPLFAALFPKFSQLSMIAQGEEEIALLYHKACQLVSVIVLPVASIMSFYSRDILMLWVRDPAIADNVHLVMTLLVIGSSINALMTIPYTLQLSYGWTRLSFLKNVIAVVLLIPLMIVLVRSFGVVGAAVTWIILNAGYFFIEIPIMHRRLLKKDMWPWYIHDVGKPMFVAVGFGMLSSLAMPGTMQPPAVLGWLVASGIVVLLLTSFSVPAIRNLMKRSFPA